MGYKPNICSYVCLMLYTSLFTNQLTQVSAYPELFINSDCLSHPDAPLKRHKAPQQNSNIQFTLSTQELCPGKTHDMVINLPFTGHMLATSSIGQFSNPADSICNNRYYTMDVTTAWTTQLIIPCSALGNAQVKVTSANGSSSPFYFNTLSLPVNIDCAASTCTNLIPPPSYPQSSPPPPKKSNPSPKTQPSQLPDWPLSPPSPPNQPISNGPNIVQFITMDNRCLTVMDAQTIESQVDCQNPNTIFEILLMEDNWYMVKQTSLQNSQTSLVCWDIPYAFMNDRTLLSLYDCNAYKDHQKFLFLPVDSTTYKILIKHSMKCVDVEGVDVMQMECTDGDNQRFYMKSL